MGKYFGTDGFRGEVNVGLTARHAYEIGRYLGRALKNAPDRQTAGRVRVVIGKDPRRSSYMYEYALSAGLTASGADAYLLHVTTTPSVAFVTRTEGFDCGVMISASHNPYTDNGIKIFDRYGEKADEGLILGIEEHLSLVERGDEMANLKYAQGGDVGRTVDHAAGRNRYIGALIGLCKTSLSGVKIGLDMANGSTFFIAKSVFDSLGAITTAIHASPDGTNINGACGSTHPESLRQCLLEKGLDMAFAFDGDGDRCICVDERGMIRDGDAIMYAMARELGRCNELENSLVVATVMSNSGFVRSLRDLGVSVVKTQVGDRYVYEKMSETGASLGGEQSGHIIFSKHGLTGDGIVTAIKLAETCVENKKKFSELFEGLELYPQTLKNVRVGDKYALMKSPAALAAIALAEEKATENFGRVLVRPSGTERAVRILVECKDSALCKRLAEELHMALKAVDSALSD